MAYSDFCISSYLTFRYVVEKGRAWKPGVAPVFPEIKVGDQVKACNENEIVTFLKQRLSASLPKNTGLLLSSGIDSAILLALLPKGTPAYTIRFVAEGALDESVGAREYAEHCDTDLTVVDVEWSDYEESMDSLMRAKQSPLHAIEPALLKASRAAADDGLDTLLVGNGADSTFGGMDKLLSKDWTFDEFVNRYTFVRPESVVRNPVSMTHIYEQCRTPTGIDVFAFLKATHGAGIIQSFENAIHTGGCKVIAPYEELRLGVPLDMDRIRNGESKYFLRAVFSSLYPDSSIPEKIPFARPMDQWLANWGGPSRPEFKDDLRIDDFTGDQKWLIYCLERFMEIM